jgi:hypothetical protein
MANARAIFERGNGFAYPNAYDPDPASPAIYFHWVIWLWGAGVKILHLDPGFLYASAGVLASLICGALTLRLVELTLPDPQGRHWWFLLTMWGGGIVALGGAVGNLEAGRSLSENLFRLDAGEGSWLSNWGRNLQVPTEAIYHCLVATAWIGVLQRRWWLAIASSTALAATHPFSGLQHLLIIGVWVTVIALRDGTRQAWSRAALVFFPGALFSGYYFLFLNRFPAHRNLAALWTVPSSWYSISGVNLLVSIGPLAILAAWSLQRKNWRLNEAEKFWVAAFGVTLLLMEHDWFIAPHQPAHFSHGYQWLPLWFIALPQLQFWSQKVRGYSNRVMTGLIYGLSAILCCADNAAFIANDLNGREANVVSFTAGQREMFDWMDNANLRGVLLCYDIRLSYYSAAYTGVRPYYGHLNNTPDIRDRWKRISAWHRLGETGAWLNTIDYVLIERSRPPKSFDHAQWRELHGNQEFVLFVREGIPSRTEAN